jgi:hypothetical protein
MRLGRFGGGGRGEIRQPFRGTLQLLVDKSPYAAFWSHSVIKSSPPIVQAKTLLVLCSVLGTVCDASCVYGLCV